MPNEGEENNPETESKGKSAKEQLNKRRHFFPTRTVIIGILGAFTAFCEIVGSSLLNSHSQPVLLCWGIIFAGLFCGCIAGRLWIINHRTKHPMPGWLDSNWTCGACILLCFCVCALSAWWAKQLPVPEPKPHIELGFSTTDPQNPFFVFPPSFDVKTNSTASKTNIIDCVYMRIPSDGSDFTLCFSVFNDSPSVVAELVSCEVSIPKEVRAVFDSSWKRSAPKRAGSQAAFFKMTSSLLPRIRTHACHNLHDRCCCPKYRKPRFCA